MVHSRCNCRCVMCDIWKTSESRELTLTDLQPHLDSFRDLGVRLYTRKPTLALGIHVDGQLDGLGVEVDLRHSSAAHSVAPQREPGTRKAAIGFRSGALQGAEKTGV